MPDTPNAVTPLGLPEMDAAHAEFEACAAALRSAAPGAHRSALQALAAHCRAHFDAERQLMESTGCPAADCHVDEHEAVMKSLHEVLAMDDAEAAPVVARLIVALDDWFPAHVDHLDSAVAHWVTKQRHGGVPLVLRRP